MISPFGAMMVLRQMRKQGYAVAGEGSNGVVALIHIFKKTMAGYQHQEDLPCEEIK